MQVKDEKIDALKNVMRWKYLNDLSRKFRLLKEQVTNDHQHQVNSRRQTEYACKLKTRMMRSVYISLKVNRTLLQ